MVVVGGWRGVLVGNGAVAVSLLLVAQRESVGQDINRPWTDESVSNGGNQASVVVLLLLRERVERWMGQGVSRLAVRRGRVSVGERRVEEEGKKVEVAVNVRVGLCASARACRRGQPAMLGGRVESRHEMRWVR